MNTRELARLGLPNQDGGVEVSATGRRAASTGRQPRARHGARDARLAALAALERPAAAAPRGRPRAIPPRPALVLRPALPVVRWQQQPPGTTPAEHLAGASAPDPRLTPRAAGWPPWLETGPDESQAKRAATGQPAAHAAIRQRSGRGHAKLFSRPRRPLRHPGGVRPCPHPPSPPAANFLDCCATTPAPEGASASPTA